MGLKTVLVPRVRLKVMFTHVVTSVVSHVTRWDRQPRDSRESLVSEVNVNHNRFLIITKWLCCLNLTSCENGTLF